MTITDSGYLPAGYALLDNQVIDGLDAFRSCTGENWWTPWTTTVSRGCSAVHSAARLQRFFSRWGPVQSFFLR